MKKILDLSQEPLPLSGFLIPDRYYVIYFFDYDSEEIAVLGKDFNKVVMDKKTELIETGRLKKGKNLDFEMMAGPLNEEGLQQYLKSLNKDEFEKYLTSIGVKNYNRGN